MADKTLTCQECGQTFVFTQGEQEFYQSRGLLNEPRRCPECRGARRQQRSQGSGRGGQTYTAVCATCGKEAQVPFEPREGRPVYCSSCYTKTKGGR